MQLTPTKEGLVKHHPISKEAPKAEEHKEAEHHMKHIIHTENRKPQKEIMSKVRQAQKVYEHSIGKSHHYGLKTLKHKKYVKH